MQVVKKWWQLNSSREAARRVKDLSDALWKDDQARRNRMRNGISLFEGRQLGGLNAAAYGRSGVYRSDYYEELWWNLPRSIAKAVEAKISGKYKPKAQVMTTDADWSMKRKAKKMDRYGEAVMHERQGRYRDLWALGRRVFRDTLICSIGHGKIIADPDDRKVVIERLLPWQVQVDPDEAEYGTPQNLIHRYPYEADRLMAQYPEHKDTILRADEPDDDDLTSRAGRSDRMTQQVQVYEIWRLPIGNEPGRHVICVKDALLVDEKWEAQEFPIETMRWDDEFLGWGATSLMEELRCANDEMNHTLQRMQEAERKCSNGVLFIDDQSQVDDEDLQSNDIGAIVRYRGNAPTYHAPNSYSQSTVEFLRLNKSIQFELTGLSERAVTGVRNPGVTAAVAMRTEDDMDTERLGPVWRMYEEWYTGVFKHIIRETRRLAESDGGADIIAKWPGQSFLREVKASDWLDLDDSKYTVSVASVSGTKNTPADRLQLAQELFGAGQLSPEAMARIQQYLDTPGEIAKQTRQADWLESEIERWLDATPEEIDSGEFVPAPADKFLAIEDAMLQVTDALFQARLDGAPEFTQTFFLDFIEQCDRILQERQAIAMQAQNPMQAVEAAPQIAAPGPPATGPAPVPNAA